MKRSLVFVPCLLFVVSPASGQMDPAREDELLARPAGVSPGGSAGFALAEACSTFSWTSMAGAEAYELRAYRLNARGELEADSALTAELPAGASSWTPAADGCLAPGERYAWSVRAQIEHGSTAWSEALLFEIAAAPTAAELQGAIEVLQRHLGTARVGEQMLGTAEADTLPTRAVAPTESPRPQGGGNETTDVVVGGGPATAVRGEVPDAAGETYGVRGVSNSQGGAGVRADNNAAGADVVLGGSPVAKLTETSLSRDSGANLTFNVTNPGAGTMSLQVDGASVLTTATDDWVNETGDTMTGTLTLSAGDVALHTAATVTKGGSRFLWDDAGNTSFGAGRGALASNTTGASNTAVGTGALDANTTGFNNVALGKAAMGSNMTANSNTAAGVYALGANTTASSNTAVGAFALISNTTGSGNTALGYGAGLNITTTSNNIIVGNAGVAGDANRIRIGATQTETFIAGISGNTTAGGIAVFVNGSGELGTSTSSRRFKEEIADLGAVSERLLALRPVSFRYTEAAAGQEERPVEYGLVAEEVAEVFPELVVYDEAGQPYTVRYHLLVPLLVNELQREQGRARRQEDQLAALLARIEALERERRPVAGARPGAG